MKNRILMAAAILLTLSACQKTDKAYYTINGSLKNFTGKMVYLYDALEGQAQPLLKDSVSVDKDGKFTWSGKLENETILYFAPALNTGSVAAVITDTQKIGFEADIQKPGEVTYTGSKASTEAQNFQKEFYNHLQAIYDWDQKNDSLIRTNSLPDSVMAGRKALTDGTVTYVKTYVSTAPDPVLKVYALSTYMAFAGNQQMAGFGLTAIEPEEMEAILTKALEAFPGNKTLTQYKNSAHEQANQIAPDFTLPDVNGKPVSLSSYRGKYVLVDFWASWCNPCRMENPNVVKAWNRFKNNPNFAILGVSLDKPDGKDAWLKAIKDDGLTWTHVSDLRYWESSVVPLYKIEGIPYNVLIDPKGRIIGESLRGEMLEKKLESVLH